MKKTHYKSMLLIGPTGSGKTPLGSICEEKGLWGRQCAHFDFGAYLRKIAEADLKPSFLTDADMEVIFHVLRSGKLLENETFYIAKNILLLFIEEKKPEKDCRLLLNGLPRHIGQAADVDEIVEVKAVLHLKCSHDVVRERILLNSGNDRAGRADDSPEYIERKMKLYEERIIPLIYHYRMKNIRIEEFEVSVDTKPDEMYEWLNAKKYHNF